MEKPRKKAKELKETVSIVMEGKGKNKGKGQKERKEVFFNKMKNFKFITNFT